MRRSALLTILMLLMLLIIIQIPIAIQTPKQSPNLQQINVGKGINHEVVYTDNWNSLNNDAVDSFERIDIGNLIYYKINVKEDHSKEEIAEAKLPCILSNAGVAAGYTNDKYNNIEDSPQLYNNGINNLYSHGIKGDGVTIAVLDGGITKEYSEDVIDSYDVEAAYNAITKEQILSKDGIISYSSEDESHGDQVSQVIAGKQDNRIGSVGVSPESKIIPIKITSGGHGDIFHLYESLLYIEKLINSGRDDIRIVNLSVALIDKEARTAQYCYDKYVLTKEINNKITQMTNDYGLVFVCASGNGYGKYVFRGKNIVYEYDGDSYAFPACCDDAISVASCDELNSLSSFSTYNDNVDLCAVGEMTTKCKNDDDSKYSTALGTSFSTPVVSGIFALMYSENRNLTKDEILSALKKTSTTLDIDYKSYRTDKYKIGVANATLTYNKLFDKNIKIDTKYVVNKKSIEYEIAYPSGSMIYTKNNIFSSDVTMFKIYGMSYKDLKGNYTLNYSKDKNHQNKLNYKLKISGEKFKNRSSSFTIPIGNKPNLTFKNVKSKSFSVRYKKEYEDNFIALIINKKKGKIVKKINVRNERHSGVFNVTGLKKNTTYNVKIRPYVVNVNYSIKDKQLRESDKKIFYGSANSYLIKTKGVANKKSNNSKLTAVI